MTATGYCDKIVMLLALILFLLLYSFSAASDVFVGWIFDFDDKNADCYVLLRGGEQIPLEFFTPLFKGDIIDIKKNDKCEEKSLRISITESNFIVVNEMNSPYSLPEKPQKNLIFKRKFVQGVAQLASDWIHRFIYPEKEKTTAAIIRRLPSRQISIPLLRDSKSWLVAGKRLFYFKWYGGTAPYRLRISPKHKSGPILDLKLSDTNIKQQVVLTEDSYLIDIQDAVGQRIQTSFEAQNKKRLPLPPKELEESNLPQSMKETLYAAWLAAQQEGAWVFEAYQRISSISENYRPAKLLSQALEQGIPSDPSLPDQNNE